MPIKHVAGPVLAVLALMNAQPALAAITTFASQSAFLAAAGTSGVDSFDDLRITYLPGPLVRQAGPYGYTASSVDDFYPAGAAADVWLANNTADQPIVFRNFTGGVHALGGLFFVSNINGEYVPGDVTVTVEAGADAATATIVGATTGSFLGFISDIPLTSASIKAVQLAPRFVWPTINNLTLAGAGVSAVPEPASWSMMIAGLGVMGAALRRRARTRFVPAR